MKWVLALPVLIKLYQYLDYGAQNDIFARLVWNIIQIMHAISLIFYNDDRFSPKNVIHFTEKQSNIRKLALWNPQTYFMPEAPTMVLCWNSKRKMWLSKSRSSPKTKIATWHFIKWHCLNMCNDTKVAIIHFLGQWRGKKSWKTWNNKENKKSDNNIDRRGY